MSFQLRADCIEILSKKKYPPVHRSVTSGFRQDLDRQPGDTDPVCVGRVKHPQGLPDQLLNPAPAHAAPHGAQHTLLLAI